MRDEARTGKEEKNEGTITPIEEKVHKKGRTGGTEGEEEEQREATLSHTLHMSVNGEQSE